MAVSDEVREAADQWESGGLAPEGGWPYKARRKLELLWDSGGGNWSNTNQIRRALQTETDTHTHTLLGCTRTHTHTVSRTKNLTQPARGGNTQPLWLFYCPPVKTERLEGGLLPPGQVDYLTAIWWNGAGWVCANEEDADNASRLAATVHSSQWFHR